MKIGGGARETIKPRDTDCVNHSWFAKGFEMGHGLLKVLALGAGLAAISLSPATAAAARSGGMIEKITPEIVSAALDTVGLTYKLQTDPRGFPMIMVDQRRLPVAQFNVLFFGCNAQSQCEDISLWSWYDLKQSVSDKAIFAWNNPLGKSRRWSTGYLDEQNDPALVLNINATGGIGEEALQILVNTYVEDLFDFKDAISTAKTSSNELPGDKAAMQSIKAADLVPSDVRVMTNLIKAYGGDSYRMTKETDTKN